MQSLAQVTLYDFQKVLTPERLKGAIVVQLAIGLAPVIMAAVFLWMASGHGDVEPRENGLETAVTLTWIHAVVAAVCYGLGTWLSARTLSEWNLKAAAERTMYDRNKRPIEDPAEKCYFLLLRSMIVRMTLFEAAALVGLMVVLISKRLGVLDEHPVFWLNLLTAGVLIVVTARTVPNKERFEQIFRERIAGS